MTNKLFKKTVIIATHTLTSGAPHELRDFIRNKVNALLFIGLPFSYCKDIRSLVEFYANGKKKYEKRIFNYKLPELLMYFKDFLLTLFLPLRFKRKFDIFIGADSLLVSVGILLRYFGVVEKVIFYTIDISSKRFENIFLNHLYHLMDKFASENADIIWNLDSSMMHERIKKGYFRKRMPNQLVVPIGVHMENDINRKSVNSKKLVYMGGLSEPFGVNLIMRSLPILKKKIKDFKLIVIGGSLSSGDMEDQFRKFVKENNLEENVVFTGYIYNQNEIKNILKECAVGLAPYKPNTYKIFCDPTKAKEYMSKGLPVIITNVPSFSKEIKENKAGIVIDYNEDQLADAVIALLTNKELSEKYKKNALELISRYRWDDIFEKTLRGSM